MIFFKKLNKVFNSTLIKEDIEKIFKKFDFDEDKIKEYIKKRIRKIIILITKD